MNKFQELINGDRPVLIDFYCEWCGPCKMLGPELKRLADKEGDRIKIIKLDVDENPEAAEAFQVVGVPTLILFHKEKELWRQSGFASVEELSEMINKMVPRT